MYKSHGHSELYVKYRICYLQCTAYIYNEQNQPGRSRDWRQFGLAEAPHRTETEIRMSCKLKP